VDMLFRPGNVHDSNGAIGFIMDNIAQLRQLNRNLNPSYSRLARPENLRFVGFH